MDNVAAWNVREYRIEKVLGEGSFGVVYLAYQKSLGRSVAIKSLGAALANDPEFIRRFEVEARIIASLEHPNIVPVYDYWREPDQAYIVMRFIRGGSLRGVLHQKGCLSLEEALQVAQQIGSALAFSHRYGVIHGDLKPENIFLDQQAYLGDFGIAQFFKDKQLGWGSPAYASPEQLNGSSLTPQSDQYMLAMVVYEMLVGQPPFPDLKTRTWRDILQEREQHTIPAITAARPDLPDQLNAILQKATAPDYRERYRDVDTLLTALQTIMPLEALIQPQRHNGAHKTQNPYKGLRPYQQGDAPYFFGREDLVAQMLSRLQAYPFLAVIGASGSGKSSVINAGLLPAVCHDLPDSDHWRSVTMFSGTQPMSELESALFRAGSIPQAQIQQALWSDQRGLMRAAQWLLPPQDRLLLVIDQFEEIYTLTPKAEERDQFLDLLYETVSNPHSAVVVVIILRTDFYDRLLQHTQWSALLSDHTFIVPMMSPLALERAIVAPASRVGVRLEPGLTARIMAEVLERPGALPILEYTLTELFDHQHDSTLTLAAFEKMGGISGALTHRANCLYAEVPAESQALIRQIFLRLVTPGEGTEDTRRRALQAELFSLDHQWERSQRIIETFSQYRLLTLDFDARTRQPTVEIAHEILIREWELLKGWIHDHRQAIRQQRFLASAAKEWAEAGQDSGYLLSEARLAPFQEWGAVINLTPAEQAYLTASRAAVARRQTDEQYRAARETQLEQRSRNILRRLLLSAAVAIIVLIGLSGVLLGQRSLIQQERDSAQTAQIKLAVQAEQAQSYALAAHARLLNDQNMPLARALALASNDIENPSVFVQLTLSEVAYEPGLAYSWQVPSGTVLAATLSADHNYIYTYTDRHIFTVKNVHSGEITRIFSSSTIKSRMAVFSSTQQYVAEVFSQNHTITLYDLNTGEIVQTFTGHTSRIASLAFSADDTRLISSSFDNQIILWDVATGQPIRTFTGYTYPIRQMILSPDGQWVLASGYDQNVMLWDLTTGNVLHHLDEHRGSVGAIAFSPDGHYALTGGDDQNVILWDLTTGVSLRKLSGHSTDVSAVAFSPDGKLALSGASDGDVIVWDLTSSAPLYRFVGQEGSITGVRFSADGQMAISSSNYNVTLWNIKHGALTALLTGHHKAIWSLAFSPDGQQAVSGSADGKLIFWDLATQQPLNEVSAGDLPYSLAYSPDGQLVAVGLQSGEVLLWDVAAARLLQTLRGHTGAIYEAAFSPDGRLLASASRDGTIMLWEVASGNRVEALIGHQSPVRSLAFSPDGTTLISAGQTLILWEVATGQRLQTLDGHTYSIYAVAFHPDGKQVVSASGDGSLILWDIATGEIIYRLLGHTGAVWDAAFSPDGRYLASVSADATVRIWDTAEGQLFRLYRSHRSGIRRVAFHPSGEYLLTGGNDTRVIMWRLDTQTELIDWIKTQYSIPALTCEQQLQYSFSNRCY